MSVTDKKGEVVSYQMETSPTPRTLQKAKAKQGDTTEGEARNAGSSTILKPTKRKRKKKSAGGPSTHGAAPRKRKSRIPRSNRKTTGDGGGGPNSPSAPKKRAKSSTDSPILNQNGDVPIKRGRGRPRGSRGTTYRRRKRAPYPDGGARTAVEDKKTFKEREFDTYVRGISSRGGGGGRGRGGRGRGRNRGGGMGRVQATRERNRALRERMILEGEEDDESEEEVGEELPFDTEALLLNNYNKRGELIEASASTYSARCPFSAPVSYRKHLDVGRRGRKRRLAVEREEVVPVQSLFKKVTRMSKGMGSKDHEQKTIGRAVKAIEDHRNQVELLWVRKSGYKAVDVSKPLHVACGLSVEQQLASVINELQEKLWACLAKSYDRFEPLLITNHSRELLLWIFKKYYFTMFRSFPKKYERLTQVTGFLLDCVQEVLKGICSLGEKCADLRFTVIELIEDITRAEAEKNMQIDMLEIFNVSVDLRKAEYLDETCIWGLKPLRIAFSPPYFKLANGSAAGPPAFKRRKQNRMALFTRSNQKWTPRDMTQLRMSIREAVIERLALTIELKYEDLIQECNEVRDKANFSIGMAKTKRAGTEGERDADQHQQQPPKKRGRPKKDPIYAYIKPHFLDLCMHPDAFDMNHYEPQFIVVRYLVNNVHIRDWRNKNMDNLNKLKFEHIVEYPQFLCLIDWVSVASKLVLVTRKVRTTNDCRLAFAHNAHPALKKKWSAADVARLLEILKAEPTLSWEDVAERFNGTKTEFTCFFRWRCQKDAEKRIKWDQEKDKQLLELAIQHRGNWKKVAAELGDSRATKNQVIERYKKKVNPILRNGAFDRVEDSLLLLALEKLKGHMNREGHFGELTAYLPWRYESTWRDRAGNVFADWVVPWTLEEDKKLMQYVVTMKRSWKHIACQFNSFKNRKGCLTRYKILQKGLKKYGTLENYHETYAMTRYNTFQCEHLDRVLVLLKQILRQPLIPFTGLEPLRPPTPSELQSLILSYNKTIVAATIHSVELYLESRNKQWEDWIERYGKKQRTFDRRTFHPEIPQSVASALHIRGVRLKPKSEVPNLSSFQRDVYLHYGRFTRTKALKKDARRPYLPTGSELLELDVVEDIVAGFELDRCPTPPATEEQGRGRWKRKLAIVSTRSKKAPAAKKKASKVVRCPPTPLRRSTRIKKVIEESETEEELKMTSDSDSE